MYGIVDCGVGISIENREKCGIIFPKSRLTALKSDILTGWLILKLPTSLITHFAELLFQKEHCEPPIYYICSNDENSQKNAVLYPTRNVMDEVYSSTLVRIVEVTKAVKAKFRRNISHFSTTRKRTTTETQKWSSSKFIAQMHKFLDCAPGIAESLS